MKPPKHRRPRIRIAELRLRDRVAETAEQAAAWMRPAPSPDDVANILDPIIGDSPREVFCALALNRKHRVCAFYRVSEGTLSSSLVHPREVFHPAILAGATALVVAHNHPSGDPEPSTEDEEVTKRLAEAGEILGIPLLDHVILGHGRVGQHYVSMRARGVL